jgi:NAD(P)H dehydrogenase (quinone)
MFAITGITGQVGGATARALLESGKAVRAVVRDEARGAPWAKRGAEIALVSDFQDTGALEAAFTGVEGIFVMIPPNFAPTEGLPEARAILSSLHRALAAAAPPKIVCLSSIGAQHASRLGLITQLYLLEQELGSLPRPSAFLRAGWFMENSAWDIEPAVKTGVMASFLQPLDRAFPLVATADIGRVAAETLQETWKGRRVLEIEGPRRYTPSEIASLLGEAVGREVAARVVPRVQWEALFQSQGTAWPAPRMEMLDGFNSGWIEFEGGSAEHVVGKVGLEKVLQELAAAARGA